MKVRNILPVILAMAALSSCTVYRGAQTPDDVYYSPAPAQEDSYLAVDNSKKGRSYDRYDNSDPDDNALRMKVRDRNRWSSIDNYSYMNDWQYNGGYYGMYSPYGAYGYGGYGYGGYGYGMGMGFGPYAYYNPWSFNSYWNSYYAWNSYYNPYCGGIIVGSGKTNPVVYNSVRSASTLSSYNNNRSYSNRNTGSGRPIYQNNNARSGTGSYYETNSNSGGLRRTYQNSNSSSSNSGYQPSYNPPASSAPVRSYSPSSSGGSSGGSSGSSSGSRPSRGGR